MAGSQVDDALRSTASEALDAFEKIATAATARLGQRGQHMGALANANQATSATTARAMNTSNADREATCQTLQRQPAIARLVLIDDDDRRETIYVTATGTIDPSPVKLCSYFSPKGRLAPVPVGEGLEISLPGGRRAFDVMEKITFTPTTDKAGWDSQPAVNHRANRPPQTIKSLRALLLDDGFSPAEVDELEAFLRAIDDPSDANVSEGLKHQTLTAMGLRVAPILDRIQDRIFRLPLATQIAVLGPPGTGKTTTLVKRLRQKVDFSFLDPESEGSLVETPDAAGLAHADSWLMFSPTELLRQYVKDAFAEAGVPVPDERVRTWDDYRREIGRRHLRVLRDGAGTGMVIRHSEGSLLPGTLTDQIAWFEAFDADQQHRFVEQIAVEANRLAAAADPGAAALGSQVEAAIARSGDRPLALVGELTGLFDRLRAVGAAQRDEARAALREPLRAFAREESTFLSDLLAFVNALDGEDIEESDDEDSEGDEGDADDRRDALRGGRLAEDIFLKAMRARAIAQASARSPNIRSRAGKLLEWLRGRELTLPDLRQVGGALLVQRAAQRLSRGTADYLTKLPLRYRQFRTATREAGQWYAPGRFDARDAHAPEIDLIILAMLRTARAMEGTPLLARRLADRPVPMLETISRLRRNQVLVDEATDFSPVQLACMRALVSPTTDAFFLSGDFNQRLTRVGARSIDDLQWVSPGLNVEQISITYRQSRQLAAFARALGDLHGYDVDERAPEYFDNEGMPPVLGRSLADLQAQTAWLSTRIREINRFTERKLPTIAVLVCDADLLDPLAAA